MKLWKNIIQGKTAFAKGILKKERKVPCTEKDTKALENVAN